MIYVTGDTHGEWMKRFNTKAFPEGKDMTKDDYVIICGDFGLWHDTKAERYNLDWLNSRPFTTLFVCGNHENYDRLYKYPVEEWHGGKIHKIKDSVYHLMRGQVFEVEGKTFFTFGGASSHDIQDGVLENNDPRINEWYRDFNKMFRINRVSWWKEELPSEEEMKEGMDNLEKCGYNVDFIVTHSPYASILAQLDQGSGLYPQDKLTKYLEQIKQKTTYKKWFFGHLHINQNFGYDNSITIFEQIIRIA